MNSLSSISHKGIIFYERPESVPYNYRISYRISILCLMLKICSRRKGCPLVKLHIINDSLENDKLIMKLKQNSECINHETIVRFDSSLNRTIEYAVSEKLIIQQVNRAYKLTEYGRKFVNDIILDKQLLKNEKNRLERINQELDEDTMKQILEMWR